VNTSSKAKAALVAILVVATLVAVNVVGTLAGAQTDYGPPLDPQVHQDACSVSVDPPTFVVVKHHVSIDGGPEVIYATPYSGAPGGRSTADIADQVGVGTHDGTYRAEWNIGSGFTETIVFTITCVPLPPAQPDPVPDAPPVPPAPPAATPVAATIRTTG